MRAQLAAAAVAGTLAVVPTAAHAEDRRPCVSETELFSVPYSATKAQIEARWEVAGVGKRGAKPGPMGDATISVDGTRLPSYTDPARFAAWTYPQCGYSLDEAWTVVRYRKRTGQVVKVVGYVLGTATLHGHSRTTLSR